MYSTVYQIYSRGVKLPKEEARANGVTGWLFLGQDSRKFYPQTTARLFQESHDEVDVLKPIVNARALIGKGGIMISGKLDIGEYQRWWCVPAVFDNSRAPAPPAEGMYVHVDVEEEVRRGAEIDAARKAAAGANAYAKRKG